MDQLLTKKLMRMAYERNGLPNCELRNIIEDILRFRKVELGLEDCYDREQYVSLLVDAAGRSIPFPSMRRVIRPLSKDISPAAAEDEDDEEDAGFLAHCLAAAAATNDLAMVTALLQDDIDVNVVSDYFGDPMGESIHAGAKEILYLLMEHGANAHLYDGYYFNDKFSNPARRRPHALIAAITARRDDMVQALISMNATLGPVTRSSFVSEALARNGQLSTLRLLEPILQGYKFSSWRQPQSLFKEAIKYGSIHIVRYLLAKLPDSMPVRSTTSSNTALSWAAAGGSTEMLRFLVDHGAVVDHDNCFPLTEAARSGQFAAVDFFIQAGVDVNVKGNIRHSRLFEALIADDISMALFLESRGARLEKVEAKECLKFVSHLGREDSVAFLLDRGVEPNDYEERDQSPLYQALASSHFRVARMLIRSGALPIDPPWTVDGDQDPSSISRRNEDPYYECSVSWDDADDPGCACTGDMGYNPSHRQTLEESAWKDFGMVRCWY